jgi:hypothetical protein
MSKPTEHTIESSDSIHSLEPTALAAVTGGVAANEQVMTVLRSVVSSIKDLATSRGGSNDSFMQMMPLMMMMRGGASAPASAAAAPACPCQTGGGDGWLKVR